MRTSFLNRFFAFHSVAAPPRCRWARLAALLGLLLLPLVASVAAEPSAGGSTEFRSLDSQVQGLKQEVLDLNRDLFILEEELLFPASTQLAVFLSLDVGEFFRLESVQLKLDNKLVTHYLYTERENAALHRGGVQRLHLGNLRTGRHELVAVFNGKGTHDRDYRRAASLTFEKTTEAKFIELKIRDLERKLQPTFEVQESK